ncbi:general transcription factor II-I repeat domain-containing protein 2-like isoform X1 [Tachypleus tridentatus]|uniref:general transcription factor II-I repeat domain-containing protein 2-like isoform X1 n=1 Tax=Tachypleus tridentatus TaxID=6853 RepID=UPI003FD2BDFE
MVRKVLLCGNKKPESYLCDMHQKCCRFERDIRRHYETKHRSTYLKFSGKFHSEKSESMKRVYESQKNLFMRKFAENESVTRTSYKIVHRMAEQGKPFTDGNIIKECMMEAANELCPEKANFFENISLSATPVVRRVEELGENIALQIHQKARNFLWYSLALDKSIVLWSTSQLLVFIHGVNLDFQIMEELASVCSTHGRTSGEDIFMEVHKTLQDYNLQWNQLRGVTVDGEKHMARVKKGLVGLIRKQLEDLQLPSALFIHCTMHQQALCGKDLDISCILKPVISAVNFIRGHALNHCQFKAFLEEIDSDFCDLLYYMAVAWLSWGKVLSHFYKLRREIDIFLIEKYRDDLLLSDPTWLSKLSFLVDITSHMNELNLKLQEKNNLVCDLYRIIKGFRRKLSLFEAHLEGGNLSFSVFQ